MSSDVRTIPKPLVQVNQSVIVLSVVLTWVTGMEWILMIPLIAGISGVLFKVNPIMEVAKGFLKKKPSQYVQEDWEQQQFNQKIAILCLGVGFLGFAFGLSIVGYIFTVLVAVAATVAPLGFCIGCFIHYQWKMYQYRKTNSQS
jgi:hypothetical protein